MTQPMLRNMLTATPLWAAGAALFVLAPFATSAAEMSEQEIIDKALSAAPPQLRAGATVVGPEGAVLQEGTNSFTCMLTPEAPTGGAPICVEKTWMPWADAWINNKDYDPAQINTVGIAYMLAGDAPHGGASNVDPQAKGRTADNEWVVEGPHVMLIAPDEALFAHLPEDPNIGGPYVMWRGQPLAHVMLPVDERPEPQTAQE